MPPADKRDGVRKKERVKKMGQQAAPSCGRCQRHTQVRAFHSLHDPCLPLSFSISSSTLPPPLLTYRRHARAARPCKSMSPLQPTSCTHVGTLAADFSMCHIQDSLAGRVSVMLRPIVPRGTYVGAT
ncbi:hypothetical protein C8J57DRAFT_1503689 [Mycena rebaudengoi]|nr:hypothetical protein C8J57DRAFT_1503689 [Mycena rebaudengoi]